MAITVNTNVSSLNAQRNLAGSGKLLSQSLQRLSSGLRINSAKDDAAGLAISDRMNAQIRGLNQAVRNANDAISLAQTAEGAMGEITNSLQRIRELAVQSANASNSSTDRASLNDEVSQLVAEIERVATTTSFNGTKMLNGTFSAQQFQVGSLKGENVSFSIGSMKSDALGVGSSASYSATVTGANLSTLTSASGVSLASHAAALDAYALAAGDLTINGYEVGATAADGVSYKGGSSSAIAVANAINAITGDTGVTATVNATSLAGTTVTGHATDIAAGAVKINGIDIGALSGTTGAVVRGADMAAAINAVSDQTGVTATYNTTTGAVAVNAADGRNITFEIATAATTAITGLGAGPNAASAGNTTVRSKVELTSTSANGITVGGLDKTTNSTGLTREHKSATMTAASGVSSVDISTQGGAENALAIIDAAIQRVDSVRGNLGAIQNRMESTISNLMNVSENVAAARSRIVDADFATETATLTKGQILQQAGLAMLAQANTVPQAALTLLQG